MPVLCGERLNLGWRGLHRPRRWCLGKVSPETGCESHKQGAATMSSSAGSGCNHFAERKRVGVCVFVIFIDMSKQSVWFFLVCICVRFCFIHVFAHQNQNATVTESRILVVQVTQRNHECRSVGLLFLHFF